MLILHGPLSTIAVGVGSIVLMIPAYNSSAGRMLQDYIAESLQIIQYRAFGRLVSCQKMLISSLSMIMLVSASNPHAT
jgi:hypothetical protein